MAELVAGLEMLHYMTPNLRYELFYWVRLSKNSLAEIDYLLPSHLNILPIEVKAGIQGGMKVCGHLCVRNTSPRLFVAH